MASRENQGLHIALILLVMLTVGLCVLSFVFYSSAQTQRDEAAKAKNTEAETRKAFDAAEFKSQKLEFMVTGQGKTLSDIEDEFANITGAAGDDDATMTAIEQTFKNNMLLFGPAETEVEKSRNYEALPDFLLSRIRDLNQQLIDLRRTENQLKTEKDNLETSAKTRIDAAEAERNKARNELATEQEKFTKYRAEIEKNRDELNNQLTDKEARIVELNNSLQDALANYNKELTKQQNTINDLRSLKKKYETTSFEVPDAIVTTINQREGVLYINVGSADNLNVQQTFSIYDKGTTGLEDVKPKGRVEVHQILGEHMAMCQVLEDKVSNVIVPGDLIFTPAWSPGERLHFAITGFIDVTGSGQNDADLLVRLIELNGGVVDDEVNVQTRYLIRGENRGATPGEEPRADMEDDWKNKLSAAVQIGVDQISPEKFLTMMGWQADVSTVTLGSGTAIELPKRKKPEEPEENPFRKRTPPRGTDGAF